MSYLRDTGTKTQGWQEGKMRSMSRGRGKRISVVHLLHGKALFSLCLDTGSNTVGKHGIFLRKVSSKVSAYTDHRNL
jgi:hypothetical protein